MKKLLFFVMILATIVSTAYSSVYKSVLNTAPSSANELLSAIPDADFVVLIDVNQLLNTKFFSLLGNSGKPNTEFKKFEDEALKFGINLRQLNHIAIAGRSATRAKTGYFQAVATGSFDREKMLAGIAAQNTKVAMQSQIYNSKTVYLLTDKASNSNSALLSMTRNLPVNYKSNTVTLSFLSQNKLVFGTLEAVKDTIDTQAGKQSNVLGNQEMGKYLSATNTSALIRFAGITPDKDKIAAAKQPTTSKTPPSAKRKKITEEDFNSGEKEPDGTTNGEDNDESNNGGGIDKLFNAIRAGYGWVDLSTGLKLDTTLLINSAEEAKQITDSLSGLLQLGKLALAGQTQKNPSQAKLLEAINQVNVSGQGTDVKIAINLPEQLINELIQLLNTGNKAP